MSEGYVRAIVLGTGRVQVNLLRLDDGSMRGVGFAEAIFKGELGEHVPDAFAVEPGIAIGFTDAAARDRFVALLNLLEWP